MKALAWLLIAISGAALANPPENFNNTIRQFARSKGMEYRGISQVGENGQPDKDVWTYTFSSPVACTKSCETMSVTFEYIRPGMHCVSNAGLFGDLPLTISGQPALFTGSMLTDETARSRDVLYAEDGKGGCYAVSYGFKGSRFDASLELMKKLLGK